MFGPETVNKDVVKGLDAEQRPAVCSIFCCLDNRVGRNAGHTILQKTFLYDIAYYL